MHYDEKRKGCPQIIPGLRGNPIWPRDLTIFPWIKYLESKVSIIQQEFLQLKEYLLRKHQLQQSQSQQQQEDNHRHHSGFQRYKSSDTSEQTTCGVWHVCYLHLHGLDFSENAKLCPNTMEAIR